MKQNIWLFLLFFLVVMIGVASGYAVARRGFVRATTLARAVDFERQKVLRRHVIFSAAGME